MILSTNGGNRILISILESHLNGDLKAEKITLRWFGPQETKEIHFTSPKAKLKAEEIIYGGTLIALLRKEIPKSLHIKNGAFNGSDIEMDFEKEKVFVKLRNVPLPEGDTLSLNLKGDFATGDFSISNIEYKEIRIKTLSGTWRNKLLTLVGNIYNTPFTLHTKLRVTLDAIQISNPITVETTNLKAEVKPFVFSYENGLNTPLNVDFYYWGIPGKFTSNIKEKSGFIDLIFDSKTCQGSIKGELSDGVLHLRENLELQLIPTAELTRLLNKNFDINLAKTSQPFTLSVKKEGFSLPLLPYNPKGFEAKKGKLDLGKFTLNNAGLAATINQFLKQKSSGDISFWFAPLDFSVQRGKVMIERTDFLMQEAFHLATWGKIRLPERRVSLILGISSEVLAKVFSLDNLSDTYVLQIPIKGNFGNVKLDTKKASERITWLLARKKVAPEVGGTWGQIFSGLTDAGEPTSPPPKKPFPWETGK
ncbi:MAG: hypothetical protein ChlgKO_09500 [Chlamydiales bacterium]